MCSMNIPYSYFDTGSPVWLASMFTTSRSGTAGAAC
jgi:hypothetical protein